jgi:transcriptional regulator with XRE-family HTH domain
MLRAKLKGKTQKALAQEIGIRPQFLSHVLNGGIVTGKIIKWLGYQKVRTRFYVKVEK